VYEMNDTPGHVPEIHFVECLSRGPAGTNVESPGVLFDYARRKGRETALDLVCIEAAFRAVGASGYRLPISVNVHVSTLFREADFPRLLEDLADRHGCSLDRVILELLEHGPEGAGLRLGRSLASLRDLGVRIALDDVGAGQSNYRRILDCGAEYLKLDRYLVQGCDSDPAREALLDSLALLGSRTGARIVAEGVETPAELVEVCRRGIGLVQGFLLGRPVPIEQLRVVLGNSRLGAVPRRREGSLIMLEAVHVNVYCASPDCDFRGSVEAESYVAEIAARRCPVCGTSPVRVEIPGRPIPRKSAAAAAIPGRTKLALVASEALPASSTRI
jgi:EAL domain-containing protein (putative c-di-GMP-specific phosphodiesterase class I)